MTGWRSFLSVMIGLSVFAPVARAGSPKCLDGSCDPSCGNIVDYDLLELHGLIPGAYQAMQLNDAGQVVGTIFSDTMFVWQDGVLTTLQFPGMVANGLAISENGTVTGIVIEPETQAVTALLWFPQSGKQQVLDTPVEIWPFALNDDLLVVGIGNDNLEGFVFNADSSTYTPLMFGEPPRMGVGTPGALGVNDAGVVAGAEVILETHPAFPKNPPAYFEKPYIWSASTGIVGLFVDPLGNSGRAVDINNNNDVAGYWHNEFFEQRPALWPDSGRELVDLGVPFGFFVAEATALNDHGQVLVVAPNDLFGFTRGYLWEDGVYKNLTARIPCSPPLDVFVGADINNHGEILAQVKPTDQNPAPLRWVILMPKQQTGADLDGDGDVDAADLALLLGSWGPCADCPADFNDDGAVNAADLALLLGMWS